MNIVETKAMTGHNRIPHPILNTGADPGFLDRGFKLAEGGGVELCSLTFFPEIPHENEII